MSLSHPRNRDFKYLSSILNIFSFRLNMDKVYRFLGGSPSTCGQVCSLLKCVCCAIKHVLGVSNVIFYKKTNVTTPKMTFVTIVTCYVSHGMLLLKAETLLSPQLELGVSQPKMTAGRRSFLFTPIDNIFP